MVAGLFYGQNLSLAGRAGIASIADFHGGRLGVDAPDSGFAFVLYRMLRDHGLERSVDYEVVSLGGTASSTCGAPVTERGRRRGPLNPWRSVAHRGRAGDGSTQRAWLGAGSEPHARGVAALESTACSVRAAPADA